MELLHERCAALDIGKKDLKACVRTPSPRVNVRGGKRSAPSPRPRMRCWSWRAY